MRKCLSWSGKFMFPALCWIFLFSLIMDYNNNKRSQNLNEDALNSYESGQPPKTILYGTPWWNNHTWFIGSGKDVFSQCPVSNCIITDNSSESNIHNFDAVIFHSWNLFTQNFQIPKKRNINQRYILFSIEALYHCAYMTDWEYKVMDDFFNTTFTFREDSDIFLPIGKVELKQDYKHRKKEGKWIEKTVTPLDERYKMIIKKKKRNILLVTSHCVTDSNREEVAKELNKTIEIDFKGACAGLWDPRLANVTLDYSRHGIDLGAEEYYFYLSFENSLCKDYVTEKFYDALAQDIVPVVYGGADYKRFAPPHSYVDIMEFQSVQEAGEYLKYLIENPEKYQEYFWWKKYYNVFGTFVDKEDRIPRDFPCVLCSYLHKSKEEKVYRDLRHWWERKAGCQGEIRGHYCNRKIEDWFPGRNYFKNYLHNTNKNKLVELQTFFD